MESSLDHKLINATLISTYQGYCIWEDPIYGGERELILTKHGKIIAQDQWEVSDYMYGIDNYKY